MWKRYGTALFLAAFFMGCSTQYRTAEPIANIEEVEEFATELGLSIDPASTSGSSNTYRYYYVSSTNGRPASSIVAVNDIQLLDSSSGWDQYVWSKDTAMNLTQVLFAEGTDADGNRNYTLGIRIQYEGSSTPVDFVATSQSPEDFVFDDNGFEANLQNGNQTIIVRSDDISDKHSDDLADAVKLVLYVLDSSGELSYLGQISTMAQY